MQRRQPRERDCRRRSAGRRGTPRSSSSRPGRIARERRQRVDAARAGCAVAQRCACWSVRNRSQAALNSSGVRCSALRAGAPGSARRTPSASLHIARRVRRVRAVVGAALHRVVRDPRLQRLGRRRAGEVGPAAPGDADVVRDHVGERVDVVLPGPVEVALEEQVRVVELLPVELAHDGPADELDEVELQDVVAGGRVGRHPERRPEHATPIAGGSASTGSARSSGRRRCPAWPRDRTPRPGNRQPMRHRS